MKSLRNKIARVLFAPLVCAAFTFVFAACSNDSEPPIFFIPIEETSTDSPTTTTDPATSTTTATAETPAAAEMPELSVPLTLEAIEAGAKVTFKNNAAGSVAYSINGGEKQTIESGASKEIALENVGDKAAFYGNNSTYTGTQGNSNIACDKDCYVYGNIMSLIKSEGFATVKKLSGKDTFHGLFNGNSHIKSKPEDELLLPAVTLAQGCYELMFAGCDGLTGAPKLPATAIADFCYFNMFMGCGGLSSAPELPAERLAFYCYSGMFKGCVGLTSAPALPATTLVTGCYDSMFEGCAGLVKAPELPATTLAARCYRRMFRNCTGLSAAPELPATTLASACYAEMFFSCTGLASAPVLPATALVEHCYNEMFSYCSNLTSVTCYATDISAYGSAMEWLIGVGDSGSFIKAAGVAWPVGASGIPEGWTGDGSGVARPQHSITIAENIAHGAVTVSATSASSGRSVLLTITPEIGYQLKTLSVIGADGSSITIRENDDNKTFVMPDKDVTVTATFVAINNPAEYAEHTENTEYTVNVGSFAHGTVTADKTSVASGTTVTLTVNPENGYQLETLIVKDANGASVATSGTGDVRSFIMPDKAVTVTASFVAVNNPAEYAEHAEYAVNVGSFAHGTVTASVPRAASGTTVTLAISPENGYKLESLVVKDANGVSVATSGTDDSKTFTMTDKEVTVTATFVVSSNLSSGAYKKIGTTTIGGKQYELVTFGLWPQAEKEASVTIDEEQVESVGKFICWKGSDGQWYEKIRNKYYKVEPIKWRVLTTNYNGTGKKLLLAENILTIYAYYDYYDVGRTIGGNKVYPNNYEHSKIRAFLNGLSYPRKESDRAAQKDCNNFLGEGFLQTAFTDDELAIIVDTIVDNSARSTYPYEYEPVGRDAGSNQFASATPTTDKVFLLSHLEATKSEYGFDISEAYGVGSARIRKATDYAKAYGAYLNITVDGGWWLRSPTNNHYNNVYGVYADGKAGYKYRVANYFDLTVAPGYGGVVPALCVEN